MEGGEGGKEDRRRDGWQWMERDERERTRRVKDNA